MSEEATTALEFGMATTACLERVAAQARGAPSLVVYCASLALAAAAMDEMREDPHAAELLPFARTRLELVLSALKGQPT